MVTAEYVTKDDLKSLLDAMGKRLETMFQEYSREQADRVIQAIQRGQSPQLLGVLPCRRRKTQIPTLPRSIWMR